MKRTLLATPVVVLYAVAAATPFVACKSGSDSGDVDPGPSDAAPGIDLNQTAKGDGGRAPKKRPDGGGGSVDDPNDPGDPGDDDDAIGVGHPPGPTPIRFATKVVSFTPGACAGFGGTDMPGIVLGPPKGAGDGQGSLDVVSLGRGGEIVLSFEPNAITDGAGTDLLVFENAFFTGGDPSNPYVELGEVSVSDDGNTWTTFPCTATAAPYGACAGWHPVYASSADLEPAKAGGNPYDLSSIGVTRARYVRIRDKTAQRCTSQGPNTNGFDLDALAAVHSD